MVVYIAQYDNGLEYDDHDNWSGEKVCVNEADCEAEIISNGYEFDGDSFRSIEKRSYNYGFAYTEKLSLVNNGGGLLRLVQDISSKDKLEERRTHKKNIVGEGGFTF